MPDLPQTFNRSLSKPKTLNYWSPSLPQQNKKLSCEKFNIFVKIKKKQKEKEVEDHALFANVHFKEQD